MDKVPCIIFKCIVFEFARSVASSTIRLIQIIATVVRPNAPTNLCSLLIEYLYYDTKKNKATKTTRWKKRSQNRSCPVPYFRTDVCLFLFFLVASLFLELGGRIVYAFPCGGHLHIGQSEQRTKDRAKEHVDAGKSSSSGTLSRSIGVGVPVGVYFLFAFGPAWRISAFANYAGCPISLDVFACVVRIMYPHSNKNGRVT